jgi:hypothetical protein
VASPIPFRDPAAVRARQRAWLEYVIETSIELLDQMDAEDGDREDDELGDEALSA